MATAQRQPADGSRAVDALLDQLQHPLRPAIEAIRALILETSPRVREEVKWSSPSFSVGEHFATLHLRSPASVLVVLHIGASRRAAERLRIDDPLGLLSWRSNERATITISAPEQIETLRPALQAILAQWLAHVEG